MLQSIGSRRVGLDLVTEREHGDLYLTAQSLSQLGLWGSSPFIVSLAWPWLDSGVLETSVRDRQLCGQLPQSWGFWLVH